MDDATLTAAFKAHTEGQTKFTRRMAIHIANTAGATPRQIVQRLERMEHLRPGAWDWFAQNGGITAAQIREALADLDAVTK